MPVPSTCPRPLQAIKSHFQQRLQGIATLRPLARDLGKTFASGLLALKRQGDGTRSLQDKPKPNQVGAGESGELGREVKIRTSSMNQHWSCHLTVSQCLGTLRTATILLHWRLLSLKSTLKVKSVGQFNFNLISVDGCAENRECLKIHFPRTQTQMLQPPNWPHTH